MAKRKAKAKNSKGKKKAGKGNLTFFIVTLLVIGLVVTIAKTRKGELPKLVSSELLATIGSTADKEAQLNSPRGIAVSPEGKIYSADLKNNRVKIFTAEGKPAGVIGKGGKQKGEFNEPSSVSVDQSGNVFVADSGNGKIQIFDKTGKYLYEIGGVKAGFYYPRNVVVNKYGIAYVADTGTSRLLKFDRDGNRIGNPSGGKGKAPGKFNEIFGIAFDSKGKTYAADPGNKKINIFTPEMQPAGTIVINSWKENPPFWPMLVTDSKDRLYVVSSGKGEIVVYDTTGKKVIYLCTLKNDMTGKPLFSSPLGIAIDKNDVLYVSDMQKNIIVKFKPVID